LSALIDELSLAVEVRLDSRDDLILKWVEELLDSAETLLPSKTEILSRAASLLKELLKLILREPLQSLRSGNLCGISWIEKGSRRTSSNTSRFCRRWP